MPKILHITSHMGGGVGKALSGITSFSSKKRLEFSHKIILLEEPEKTNFIDICQDSNVEVIITADNDLISREIEKADIVQLEWWHHPKMAEFLYNFPQIPLHLIIWCHISGCNYPVVPYDFVKLPHRFIFTSLYSLENPLWNAEYNEIGKISSVVNSSGGFEHIDPTSTIEHDGFNIGYVGTLSYNKLHPDFIDYCAEIKIRNSRFIMVGDNQNIEIIKREAKKRKIWDRFEFVGYSNNVVKELSRFDVFSYPLNPQHYGTTENALLEAMAAGLPVIVLNQCAEKYLVEHMNTGLLANNKEEFSQYIQYLFEKPHERIRLGKNAREFVMREFSIEKTVEKLQHEYNLISSMPKSTINFKKVFGDRPYRWFLACLGSERKYFEDAINMKCSASRNNLKDYLLKSSLRFSERSKSSLCHFARYFPDDGYLGKWEKLLIKEIKHVT